ncbi:DUF732 domain-containing protein [Nocardia puris]|uniref:Uncharacterized protein DUF732 n=1 Tax=Nocardia puris TaxID=208602 RepID=A0A366DRB1_9NOCA|nr:DUF732 domain-containing protein [Nocardia puris]MBF6214270.1 DUF732 domain-containing protein [Nocardia puris]MBF6365240.1 DUF732 domain-containing protein [Nocardia puris]MBF6459642.1 DUF732 domain-containing protein [Nocardia puris]RBO91814.1 uncharacterized protein DUF732 [Nocardia puris]
MHRTRGKVFGVAVAVAATALLTACGDNDSTASSTPTLTTTAAAPTSAAAPTGAENHEDHGQTPAPAPETTPQAETPAPERPQPVPTAETPQGSADLSERDQKFLDALKEQGITPYGPDIALSIAAYVCDGTASGVSDQEITTFVNAMAGADPSFDPAKMPVEKAGEIYIQTAKSTYCQ